jgi:hypothetical protein
MSGPAALIVCYVLALMALVGIIIYATVVIRRDNNTVRKPRAITAEYEKKIQEQDTVRLRRDWESYYRDGDRGDDDGDNGPRHARR